MGLRKKLTNGIPRRTIDLQELSLDLGEIFDDPNITIYIFGSRKDRTGSIRSDVDILVEKVGRPTQSQMEEIWDREPYLDVFTIDNGVAASLVNESQLRADSNESLIEKLGAQCLMKDGNWRGDAYRLQEVLAQRNPAASIVPLYDLEDAVPAERADLLVVTALTEEYDAVVRALGFAGPMDSSITANIRDNETSPWKIRVVNLHEMGSVGAALKTAEAMRRSKPAHVVLIGICGGIPDRSKLLDVVVPESILYYEPGKTMPTGISPGFKGHNCDYQSRRNISHLALHITGATILANGELMACGEKVIADEDTRTSLANTHRKLAGIDMESYGVVRAAELRSTPATVIKAVCDLADQNKSDDIHQQACEAAARVFVEAVKAGAFRR